MEYLSSNIILFLLPHQDDECGVYNVIETSVACGFCPVVIYLTDGEGGNASADVRNAESLAILRHMGVRNEHVLFLGQQNKIPDKGLMHHLDEVFTIVCDEVKRFGEGFSITSVYVTAWEGGHPDHDAAALLGIALAKSLQINDAVYQFPLYNRYKCRILPYAVFNPIEEAGDIDYIDIRKIIAIKYLMYCFLYKSQWRTFLGLLPFMLWHHIKRPCQLRQLLQEKMLCRPPHTGQLLYEARGWLKYTEFERAILAFREKHKIGLSTAETGVSKIM